MVTVSGFFVPWPLYRVERPVLLSETQNGLLALALRPQGLTRLGSKLAAMPWTLETRSVCRNVPCLPLPGAGAGACDSRP